MYHMVRVLLSWIPIWRQNAQIFHATRPILELDLEQMLQKKYCYSLANMILVDYRGLFYEVCRCPPLVIRVPVSREC